jgi:hypothetical protein
MDIVDIAWLLGETLGLAWITCGAVVTAFESSDPADLALQASELPPALFYAPPNLRVSA